MLQYYLTHALIEPLVFIVPTLIVLIFHKRPWLALFVAIFGIFLQIFVLNVIGAIDAVNLYGEPWRLYVGISEGFIFALVGMLIYGPVLYLLQKLRLRFERYRDEHSRDFW